MTMIKIPRWLCEPTIPQVAAGSQQLTDYNAASGDAAISAGDPNPLWEYLLKAAIYGFTLTPTSNRSITQLVDLDVEQSTLRFFTRGADVRRLLAGGGDLLGYATFWQLPAAGLTTDAPANWPNRSYLDENEVEVVRTVQSYFAESANFSQYPVSFDGGTTYVIPCQDPWNGGRYWPASVWFNPPGSVQIRDVDWFESQQQG